MCGIAGYWGVKEHSKETIKETLEIMKNRGPDNQNFNIFKTKDKKHLYLLHSRLSIIDLDDRANQPFKIDDYTIIFNGEIYNYIELREELIKKGAKFKTNSDTEVLLMYYKYYGTDCLKYLDGMWSFVIWDSKKNIVFMSRDRFGEKPLYLMKSNFGIYFSSEIKFLKRLSGEKLSLNEDKLYRNLLFGYKSLYKKKGTFFEKVYELNAAEYLIIKNDSIKSERYWEPKFNPNNLLSEQEAIDETSKLLIESVRKQIRSDVPLAFTLSGGVDSSSLASIAVKKFNCNIKTFSIIDDDERYNEEENINKTVNDLGCKHESFRINLKDSLLNLKKLEELIDYHEKPISTLSSFVQSFLMQKINENGYKVTFSGTSADELFTGYYDHFLLHLFTISENQEYKKALNDWKKYIYQHIRNPVLKDPYLYNKNKDFRDHIYDGNEEIKNFFYTQSEEIFTEIKYTDDLLRNRMLNELRTEATPIILCESDLNAMFYSIENRAPFLDKKLMEFAYTIPSKYLIKNGYAKNILRSSLKNILNEDVRLDRKKRGFNVSINSIIDLKNKKIKDSLLNSNSDIFKIIKKSEIEKLFLQDFIPNHLSKFLFSFINTKIFLEKNNV